MHLRPLLLALPLLFTTGCQDLIDLLDCDADEEPCGQSDPTSGPVRHRQLVDVDVTDEGFALAMRATETLTDRLPEEEIFFVHPQREFGAENQGDLLDRDANVDMVLRNIATNGDDMLVVWHDQNSVVMQLFTMAGAALGDPATFDIALDDEPDIDATFDGTNYLVVVNDANGQVIGVRVAPDGSIIDPEGFVIGLGDTWRLWTVSTGIETLVVWSGIAEWRDNWAAYVSPSGEVSEPILIQERGPSDLGRCLPPETDGEKYFLLCIGPTAEGEWKPRVIELEPETGQRTERPLPTFVEGVSAFASGEAEHALVTGSYPTHEFVLVDRTGNLLAEPIPLVQFPEFNRGGDLTLVHRDGVYLLVVAYSKTSAIRFDANGRFLDNDTFEIASSGSVR